MHEARRHTKSRRNAVAFDQQTEIPEEAVIDPLLTPHLLCITTKSPPEVGTGSNSSSPVPLTVEN